jgi:hypothetical protein
LYRSSEKTATLSGVKTLELQVHRPHRESLLFYRKNGFREHPRIPMSKFLTGCSSWLPESVWPFQTFGREVDGFMVAITDVGRRPVLLFVHTGLWSFIWHQLMLHRPEELDDRRQSPRNGRLVRRLTAAGWEF